jgi:hypothetical protein
MKSQDLKLGTKQFAMAELKFIEKNTQQTTLLCLSKSNK